MRHDLDDPEESQRRDLEFVDALRTALVSSIASAGITDSPSSATLLTSIVRAAARAIPCPEGALLLVDYQRRVLTFEVVIGSTSATVRDITVPLGHGIAGLVAASGQALAISNAEEDPRHARDIAERSGYLPTTILAVPVPGDDGETAGVLELLDRQGQPTFSLGDMELLGMFAEQVAIVLEKRRTEDDLAVRVATAIGALGGIPSDAQRQIADRSDVIVSRVENDDLSRRAYELATLVSSIASHGAAEYEACRAILAAFEEYFESTPSLGMGMFQ